MFDRAARTTKDDEHGDALAHAATAVLEDAQPVRRSALVVGPADDPYEREADRVADEVVNRLAGSPLRRRSSGGTDPLGGQPVTADLERDIRGATGRPLDAGVRGPMEQAMGTDLGAVRIHDDDQADRLSRSLQAEAFTVGSDVFFRGDRYQPQTPSGQHLLAHELAHVAQEGGGAHRQVRRFVDLATFREKTSEGRFTRKSTAQKHIEELIGQYNALRGGGEIGGKANTDTSLIPDSKLDQAIALVQAMKETADSWIKGHTVTDDSGTVLSDPSRLKRKAGMEWFIAECDKRINLLNQFKARAVGPQDAVEVDEKTGKIKEHYEGSATSMLARIGYLLDMAVPSDGDSTEFELEFKIPVEPSGVGFVGGIIRMSAERDKFVKARGEILVTGGANVGLAELKAGLGGYVEASAVKSADVMKLFSYGMYRRLRESNVPSEVSNFIWGGSTSDYGKTKADQWSRDIEQQMWGNKKQKPTGMSDDDYFDGTYVESGGIAEAGAELDLAVASLGIGAQYTEGLRYDKQSLDARKGGAGAKNVKSDSWFTKNVANKFGRGAEKRLGRTVRNLEISVEAEGGPFSGELSLSLGFESTGAHGQMNVTPLTSVEVGLSLGASLPSTELVGTGFGPFIGTVVTTAVDALRRGIKRGSDQVATDRGVKDAGAVIAAGENLTTGITQLAKVPTEAFKLEFDTTETTGFSGSIGLSADFGFEASRGGATEPWEYEGSFELKHTKSYDYNLPKALSVSLTRAKRLIKVNFPSMSIE